MSGIILRFPQTFLNIILSPRQLLDLSTGIMDCILVIKAAQTRGNVLLLLLFLKSCLQSTETLEGLLIFLISQISGAVPEPLQVWAPVRISRVTRWSDDGWFVVRLLLRSAVYGHVPQRCLNTSVRFPAPQILSSL